MQQRVFAITAAASLAGSASAGLTGFGITDAGQAGSQLVTWSPGDLAVTNIGPVYNNYDLESSDINAAGDGFVIAGGNGGFKDELFQADKSTGALTSLGVIGFANPANSNREVVSASFNDTTGDLWVYRQSVGFFSIDLANPLVPNSQFSRPGNVEAMAWNPAGDTLYYFDQRDLFSWDAVNGETAIATGVFNDSVEALEFDLNGNLIAGLERNNDSFDLFQVALDGSSTTLIDTFDAPSASGDIESLTFIPAPGSAALAAFAGLAAARRRR